MAFAVVVAVIVGWLLIILAKHARIRREGAALPPGTGRAGRGGR